MGEPSCIAVFVVFLSLVLIVIWMSTAYLLGLKFKGDIENLQDSEGLKDEDFSVHFKQDLWTDPE
ncbi:MAG: hypothetical protein WBE27_01650 [Microgenomates group bacterium]